MTLQKLLSTCEVNFPIPVKSWSWQQLQTPGVDFWWELEELKMSYKIQRAEIKRIQEAHIERDVELQGDLTVLIGIQIQM